MSYYELPEDERLSYEFETTWIRMAIGIEDTDDIILDLKQALEG